MNGNGNASSSSNGRNENGSYDAHAPSSSPPTAIPNGNEDHNHLNISEKAPLLTRTSSLSYNNTHGFLDACRPSTNSPAWGTDAFLSCSPMISGHRGSLRLPDLDKREARRIAAAAANARMLENQRYDPVQGRSRSRSLGTETERGQLGDDPDQTSPLLLGESILKRRTPSGLSLLDLNEDTVELEKDDDFFKPSDEADGANVKYEDEGYGATTTTAIYNEPLREPEERRKPIKTSQSCSIPSATPSLPSSSPKPTPKVASSENTLVQELKNEFQSESNPVILSILYALVNFSIVMPVIMSFGSIIYHDEFFRPYLSILMKLTVVSGAIHQFTFATASSLPFAVGQVQDAGLIFLSAMARDLVARLRFMGVEDVSILATVTIGLSLYTAMLGCALIIIGKFQLASYCQLLPSSVVGGYLAYIGFFCGQAGLALMASVDVTGLAEWYKFLDGDALTLLAPGVLGGFFIYFSVRTYRHMAVLPTCIIMLMVVFYVTLWATGTSVEEATQNGWINASVETPSWVHTWDFLKVDKVVWSVLPSQTVTVLAMISVVALSSSLDIAAIEIELKRPLDYNHELKTVGLSNIISGLTGGYTGSYIFSQTIFSLRMGIRSRLMGYILACLSIVAVVIPIDILAYIPNFFFGSLLMMICLDLLFEWLIDVRGQVTPAEYVVLLSTFILLQVLGVEFGIIAGIVLHVVISKMGYDVGKDEKLNDEGIAITDNGAHAQINL